MDDAINLGRRHGSYASNAMRHRRSEGVICTMKVEGKTKSQDSDQPDGSDNDETGGVQLFRGFRFGFGAGVGGPTKKDSDGHDGQKGDPGANDSRITAVQRNTVVVTVTEVCSSPTVVPSSTAIVVSTRTIVAISTSISVPTLTSSGLPSAISVTPSSSLDDNPSFTPPSQALSSNLPLPSGSIIAIVIGCIMFVSLVAGFLYRKLSLRRKFQDHELSPYTGQTNGRMISCARKKEDFRPDDNTEYSAIDLRRLMVLRFGNPRAGTLTTITEVSSTRETALTSPSHPTPEANVISLYKPESRRTSNRTPIASSVVSSVDSHLLTL
ncbi:hypothetical protein B0H34DRAFT_795329 [Crassisporium funariophilum]|nr:hypothetical protein B0H34DRAFT_795329 [Crassisporium funariophilum]